MGSSKSNYKKSKKINNKRIKETKNKFMYFKHKFIIY